METISEQRCFGGVQGIYAHESDTVGTPMRFSVFSPPAAENGPVPVLWYLSGLTCTEGELHRQGRGPALRRGTWPHARCAGYQSPGRRDRW